MVNLAAALITTSLIIVGCVVGMVVMIMIFRDSIHEHYRAAAIHYHSKTEDAIEKIDHLYREARDKVRNLS